ncbi:hypothetical protein [Viscerimonas tarda]
MKYSNIREEELKNKVGQDFFERYDCTDIKGFIDFAVKLKRSKGSIDFADEYLLWAEAKQRPTDILVMLTQLVLTIGKARTFDNHLPPPFLGCFDCEKIAFVPYSDIQDIFYQNDFNWNVTSSNHETKEFKQVYEQVKKVIENDIPWETYLFDFETDEKELRKFIRDNFIVGKGDATKIKIDKNNFIIIYNKWLEAVLPTISFNWEAAKKNGIISGDFYLADLLSSPLEGGKEYTSLKEKLFVVLRATRYEMNRHKDEYGAFTSSTVEFTDNQKAYKQFWNKYERPPKEEYWDYIIERRDQIVPQDVRERKGSFFTPGIWVELSQKYIADVFGEDWQDEYYVWDCAAGTGNLLAGLTNKYNIWASTLDKQDVDVMHDRIKNGANLLESHVFQFDFLNDDFDKLPQGLQDIINDLEKRKNLIIYINPPYAEASNKKTLEKGVEGNRGVEQSAVNKRYAKLLGQGNAELFAQFFTRIYCEINGVVLTEFSKLKILSGQHFINFRDFFQAKLEKIFVCPANTFDNVKGQFPIGFMIWDTSKKERFEHVVADVYNKIGEFIETKSYFAYDNSDYINDWIKPLRGKPNKNIIGKFPFKGNDFQNQNMIQIVHPSMDYNTEAGQFLINKNNLLESCIYFAVRKVIEANWLNDRDQFLYPNERWKTDKEFQNNCLAYTLFNNNIQSKYGVNHWIPFTEAEVNARDKFESNFMTDFIAGKIKADKPRDLFSQDSTELEGRTSKGGVVSPLLCNSSLKLGNGLQFSPAAIAVFDAGRELWKYYHVQFGRMDAASEQVNYNVNASFYDIREYFQGRNDAGKMNNSSNDSNYTELIGNLRDKLKLLAKAIEPKVYEYEFLKK